MRLDKFLKVSRLIKRRTVANETCDAECVLVNDKPAKASVSAKIGDIIEIQFGVKAVKVKVLDVQETVEKDEAKELYCHIQRQFALDVLTVAISKISGIEWPTSPYI